MVILWNLIHTQWFKASLSRLHIAPCNHSMTVLGWWRSSLMCYVQVIELRWDLAIPVLSHDWLKCVTWLIGVCHMIGWSVSHDWLGVCHMTDWSVSHDWGVWCAIGNLHFQIIHSADVTSSLRLQPMALLVLAGSSTKSHLRMPDNMHGNVLCMRLQPMHAWQHGNVLCMT